MLIDYGTTTTGYTFGPTGTTSTYVSYGSRETINFKGKRYRIEDYEICSDGTITVKGILDDSGTETKVKLEPSYINYNREWLEKEKQKAKFRIRKIQTNPKKNATTVIFENGHVEVIKRNDLDPEADLYSVVAYAVAKYVYGSNSAFKRQIRDCIFESLEVK